MEGLIKQALASLEGELKRLAGAFMADPAFAERHHDEMLWEATSATSCVLASTLGKSRPMT